MFALTAQRDLDFAGRVEVAEPVFGIIGIKYAAREKPAAFRGPIVVEAAQRRGQIGKLESLAFNRGIDWATDRSFDRSEEHTSELQSLMRISYAVFCLKKKKTSTQVPKY